MLDVTRLLDIYNASIDVNLTSVPVHFWRFVTFAPDPSIPDLLSTEAGAYSYRVWKFSKDITLLRITPPISLASSSGPNYDHSFVGLETTTAASLWPSQQRLPTC